MARKPVIPGQNWVPPREVSARNPDKQTASQPRKLSQTEEVELKRELSRLRDRLRDIRAEPNTDPNKRRRQVQHLTRRIHETEVSLGIAKGAHLRRSQDRALTNGLGDAPSEPHATFSTRGPGPRPPPRPQPPRGRSKDS